MNTSPAPALRSSDVIQWRRRRVGPNKLRAGVVRTIATPLCRPRRSMLICSTLAQGTISPNIPYMRSPSGAARNATRSSAIQISLIEDQPSRAKTARKPHPTPAQLASVSSRGNHPCRPSRSAGPREFGLTAQWRNSSDVTNTKIAQNPANSARQHSAAPSGSAWLKYGSPARKPPARFHASTR